MVERIENRWGAFGLTTRDDKLLNSGSRDPLGLEVIWTSFGARMVPRLSTISRGVGSFAAHLAHTWIVEEYLAARPGLELAVNGQEPPGHRHGHAQARTLRRRPRRAHPRQPNARSPPHRTSHGRAADRTARIRRPRSLHTRRARHGHHVSLDAHARRRTRTHPARMDRRSWLAIPMRPDLVLALPSSYAATPRNWLVLLCFSLNRTRMT